MPKTSKYSGFTLIELSIVLVIIGLIVGGVLVGQDLIETSKRQNIVSKWQALSTQVNTFKLKYDCLPGDCQNASSFFGLATNTNGDGNRQIWNSGSTFSHPSLGWERCHFWVHLAKAGLSDYTSDACTALGAVELHTPTLPFNKLSHYYISAQCAADNCNSTDGAQNTHWILTHGQYNGVNSQYLSAASSVHIAESPFTVLDVLWLDTKIDDGAARTGTFTLMRNQGTLAADSDPCIETGADNEYNMAEERRVCHSRFKASF